MASLVREDVDLDAAVRAGVLGEDQAIALRNLAARQAGTPAPSREKFEIFSGLADIMTALAIVALMAAVVGFTGTFPPLALLVFPAMLWAGRRFTIERNFAATALLLFFFYCVATSTIGMMIAFGATAEAVTGRGFDTLREPTALWIVGVLTTTGCWLWWRSCRLPVAVAAGWVAGMNLATNLVRIAFPQAPSVVASIAILAWGLVMLGAAIWWDMTDVRRETIRSRVGFWLHAAAGFFIAKAVLALLAGRHDTADGWMGIYFAKANDVGPDVALLFLLFFAVCLAVSLLLDRRSLIFSTMWQALIAIAALTANMPAALAIAGALLLTMALRWQKMRSMILNRLPLAVRAQLPRVEVEQEGRRPTRRYEEMHPRRSFGRRAA